MKNIVLNETPVRTSKNYGINNIEIKEFEEPVIKEFKNIKITDNENCVSSEKENINLKFGLGEYFLNQSNEQSNVNLKINVDKKLKEPIIIEYNLDKSNDVLVDDININANDNTKANIIVIYKSVDEINGYHNGICNAEIGANANIHVTIVNLLNTKINNFYSVNSNIEDESKTLFSMVEFGGKYNVVNYYAKLAGYKSVNKLHSIYLGKEEQKIDLNYITELYGEKTNVDIEVNGALKDKSRKNFKGTIDFKTGSKKAKGKENEYCTLLSDTSYSKALPMLLCTEDDVEGQHSTATGKVDENELFYIMTRGISEKEAKKMIVKAKFNSVIQGIKEETVQNLILEEVDRRLD